MRVAVASGKGGTGKTTVAVNLAVAAAGMSKGAAYIDCDVEEPNGHIFLKPAIEESETVTVPVPVVDDSRCTACGECGRICRFKAIVMILDEVLTFPELCHGCGGCSLVCPVEAITEKPREVGKIERGRARLRGGGNGGAARSLDFIHGILNVKEAMPTPVIREVKAKMPEKGLSIIDAPPGASCAMVESVRGVDYVLLVAEPTPFGLNDLAITVETVRELGLPAGVVVNRYGMGDDGVRNFCVNEGITILGEIQDDRRVAEIYSDGGLICEILPSFRQRMQELLKNIFQEMFSLHGIQGRDAL